MNRAPALSRPARPLKRSRVGVGTGTNAPSGEVSVSFASSPASVGRSFWICRPNEMKSWPGPAGSAPVQPPFSGRGCVPQRGSGARAEPGVGVTARAEPAAAAPVAGDLDVAADDGRTAVGGARGGGLGVVV